MRSRDRLLAMLAVLLVIGVFKVAQQIYHFYLFSDERAALMELEREVEEAGLGVIQTQLQADSLRDAIEQADAELLVGRLELDRVEQQFLRAPVTRAAELSYRDRLAEYNDRVAHRNDLYRVWRIAVDANHRYVERYNLLVDSIRTVAAAMGEPYYPVLSPAEMTVRREAAAEDP